MCIVYLPWGDSYILSSDNAVAYLNVLGVPESESPISYLWNFYGVIVDRKTGHYISATIEDIEKAAKDLRVMQTLRDRLTSLVESDDAASPC